MAYSDAVSRHQRAIPALSAAPSTSASAADELVGGEDLFRRRQDEAFDGDCGDGAGGVEPGQELCPDGVADAGAVDDQPSSGADGQQEHPRLGKPEHGPHRPLDPERAAPGRLGREVTVAEGDSCGERAVGQAGQHVLALSGSADARQHG